MKMRFANILTELWCSPWLIVPAVHRKLCDIVEAHITGAAHTPGGIVAAFGKPEDDDEDEYAWAVENGIAVLPVHGLLGQHVGSMERSSGTTDISDIAAALASAMADDAVSGVLLDVNSPGGTTGGIPELATAIAQASLRKPIVAFTDSLMASAAYWLASGSDAIVASQSAQVGSIGVYMAWLDNSRAMEMQGYRTELIKHGKWKGMGVSGTSLSDEARAMLQQTVDQVYDWFSGHVRMFREDVAQEAMEGQTFFAGAARDADLVDLMGSRDDAMREVLDMVAEKKGDTK